VLIVVTAATACSDDTAEMPGPAIRGAYGRDSSESGVEVMRSVGLDTVTAPPDVATLDRLQAEGMRAIVWLGAYDRAVSDPCAFERDDGWIRRRIGAAAGHPAIAAYQITDEPDGSLGECPEVVAQVRARAELVASIDSSAPTYLTISKSGYTYERWAPLVDILGLVIYPVSIRGYNPDMIPTAIAKAEADGVRRYWAVVQDFGTPNWYVVPTPEQLQRQFDQWRGSPLEGYVIYHWVLGGIEDRPDQMGVLSGVNG
jgi:hypothetical protein